MGKRRYRHDQGMDRWVCTWVLLGVLALWLVLFIALGPMGIFFAGCLTPWAVEHAYDTYCTWRDYFDSRRAG